MKNYQETNTKRSRAINKGQSGFTLVELLVGLTVGISVLGTVAAVFVPTLNSYRTNEALAFIQENERYSIGLLSRFVDQAGFFGCDSTDPSTLINATSLPAATLGWVSQMNQPIRVSSPGVLTSNVIGSNETSRKFDSGLPVGDVLTSLSSSTLSALLVDHNPVAETVTFRSSSDLSDRLDGEIILLNDCNNSAMFEIAKITAGAGGYDATANTTTFSYANADTSNCNAASPIRVLLGGSGSGVPSCDNTSAYAEYTFQAGANATALVAQSLFIRPSSINPAINNSLYSVIVNADGSYGAPEELLVGVDNFRARVGVQGTSGTRIDFRDARSFPTQLSGGNTIPADSDGDTVNETIENIVAIEISLLLSSITDKGERSTDGRQSFSFPNYAGVQVDCGADGSGLAHTTACPSFLNATVTDPNIGDVNLSKRLRRTVTKVFNLRNATL